MPLQPKEMVEALEKVTTDLAQLKEMVGKRLEQLEARMGQTILTKAESGENGSAASQGESANEQHPAGLCGDETCSPCVGTRSRYASLQSKALVEQRQQVRQDIFAKLNQAAQLEDLVEQSNSLGQRFVAIEKGTPGPQVINLPGGERLVLA